MAGTWRSVPYCQPGNKRVEGGVPTRAIAAPRGLVGQRMAGKRAGYRAVIAAMFGLGLLSPARHPDFLAEQMKYGRVREAKARKQEKLERMLAGAGLQADNLNVLLVACKEGDRLDVYAKAAQDTSYVRLKTYPICARSGGPGPKRRQGDRQVPEGFYHIDRFNPVSSYHLSLGINYPNLSDRRKSAAENLGGDIFIHGSCITIGCLPMTDDAIREIYLLCVYAKNGGQAVIPVYIFPFAMTDANMDLHRRIHAKDPGLLRFWDNLKTGHDRFLGTRRQLDVRVLANGDYAF